MPDQWELYNLDQDPTEYTNLLVFDGAFPTPIAQPPAWTSTDEIVAVATELHAELQRQEAWLLSPYPSAHPSAGAVSH